MRPALTLAAALFAVFETSGAALAAPADRATACSLLTQPAAAAIFGGPVNPGAGANTGAANACEFDSPTSGGMVTVGLIDAKSYGLAPATVFKMAVKPDPGQTTEPAPGLGETGLYFTSPAESTVAVLYRAKVLTISVQSSKNPGLKAALVQAARQILGKM